MRRTILTTMFVAIILLCLGFSVLYGEEAQRVNAPQPLRTISNTPRLMMRLMDLNNDGRISAAEYQKFFIDADQDKDGSLTSDEIMSFMSRKTMEVSGPNVGDMAPDFSLRTLDGKSTIKLSDLRGNQPVVLVFGSYT